MNPIALASIFCPQVDNLSTGDRLPEEPIVRDPNSLLEPLQPASEDPKRCAIVVDRTLEPGAMANAVAIVSGGLQCEAFGYPIPDADGNLHAAIRWNLVVLQAKSGQQLKKLLLATKERPVKAVAFARFGQGLSNSFILYEEAIASRPTEEFDIIAVGLFGSDADVRGQTKAFSVLK
jgi:Protein of unknown function (DUF2000)